MNIHTMHKGMCFDLKKMSGVLLLIQRETYFQSYFDILCVTTTSQSLSSQTYLDIIWHNGQHQNQMSSDVGWSFKLCWTFSKKSIQGECFTLELKCHNFQIKSRLETRFMPLIQADSITVMHFLLAAPKENCDASVHSKLCSLPFSQNQEERAYQTSRG